MLRKALKQQLGPKAEQLTAFQVQPFRGRKAKNSGETPAPGAEGTTPPAGSTVR